MKKILFILAGLFVMMHALMAQTKDKKILVVYYSRTGTTAQIARYIQESTNADIFEIIPVNAYPDDYDSMTEQAKKEINEGYLPPIKGGLSNISDYDVIFIGSPCWWSTIAPPVSTFLSQHDLAGKTVVPFSTHGGSGLANNAIDTAKKSKRSKNSEWAGL